MDDTGTPGYGADLDRHVRHPVGAAPLPAPDREAVLHNPLCGDAVRVQLAFGPRDEVRAIAVVPEGCCILCRASGSVLAGEVAGRGQGDARDHVAGFLAGATASAGTRSLADAARRFPTRERCVTLPWAAAAVALAPAAAAPDNQGPVG